MRRATPGLVIVGILLCGLSGCQATTRSGAALERRLARSLRQLWTVSLDLARDEARRPRRLLDAAQPARVLQPGALRRGIDHTTACLAQSARRVRVLPSALAATMTRIERRAGGDIQRLIRPGPSDVLNPPRFARELGRWRRELMRLPEHLGIATPILPGPGDSEQLGRRLSWVERLLLRF